MKLKKKDLLILIPLIVMGVLITASVIYEYYTTEDEIILSTQCQEGWFKYESEAGTLCSKTELSPRQIEEYGK